MKRRTPTIRRSRGFTLVEVIVVAILLSFAALAVVPSLRANPSAKFQLATDQVMDLLSVYALRDRTGNAPVALQRQLDFQGMEVVSDRLALLVQDEIDGVTEWRIDPHVRPVELIEAISRDGIDVRLDGELIDTEGEPIAHRPGEDRPDILVLLRQEDLQLTSMIRLSPWSIAPSRDGRAEAMDEIDLDGLGRSEVDW
ncbi:MAG TPA: hypothetical protein DEQ73_05915 [Phycisphaerales bacterium]|jgi:prepilin-type N-terminal cleavage/methylation domain-containing protein|nr:MAG: type II secretion system protein [Phycisphaera sp. TMED24]HCD30119.1 hypothetical protein [Phycisphaerales bacterium]